MDSTAADSFERNGTGTDAEAQRAARDAIMEIRLFPDLTVALRGALGYGPHVDMLQHFCYWMHPRHPKMQNRWTMYKTYKEWRNECSLSERQVRKGRKVLRELGLVTEKKSNYGRIDYRVDWVTLAEALSLDTITVQVQSGRYSEESRLDGNSVQANAREQETNAVAYNRITSPYRASAEPAFAEPAPPKMNKKEEPQEDDWSPLDTNKRLSQVSEPPKAKIAKEVEVKSWALIFAHQTRSFYRRAGSGEGTRTSQERRAAQRILTICATNPRR